MTTRRPKMKPTFDFIFYRKLRFANEVVNRQPDRPVATDQARFGRSRAEAVEDNAPEPSRRRGRATRAQGVVLPHEAANSKRLPPTRS